MNIEEAKKKLLEPQKIPLVEIIRKFKREGIENFVITRPEIVETLLTAYEKEKEKNKELDKENQGLFELYNFNDTSLLAKILKDYKNTIEKQQKEIEELKEGIENIIKNELPDDEICNCCNVFDVNGIEIKEKLQSLLEKE